MNCKLHLPVLILLLLLCSASVRSDDQNCMNKATKVIYVKVDEDNPNKVLTYVRDDPGYKKGLECKWIMHASDYSKPRQMLLNVKAVDFDNDTAANADCANPNLDMFNFTIRGNSTTEGQVKSQKWCSKQSVTSRLMLINLWDWSNYLTVEFRSDNVENRSNAKGVEMDVVIMSRDYCHRSMLFHNGSCYLITEQHPIYGESFDTAKYLLGNVAPFADEKSVQLFLKSNNDRVDVYPYKPAFDLSSGQIWTGNFMRSGDSIVGFMDPSNGCKFTPSSITANRTTDAECGVAMQVINGAPSFTCEPMTRTLPALPKFPQITDNKANKNDSVFISCDSNDLARALEPSPSPTRLPPAPSCQLGCIIIIIVICIVVLASGTVVVIVIVYRKRMRSKDRPVCNCTGECTCGAGKEGQPLQVENALRPVRA